MEQKLSDTLVKAIDRSNPMMQNLQLASRFNKLVEEGGGSADLEDNKEVTITENGEIEITPTEGKDGMKKVTATVNVAIANLTSKGLDAQAIRTSVENEQAITPPNGVDGFSEITFNPGLLSVVTVTKNQTMEFGTDDAPYFPKKLIVSTPSSSDYTLETLSLDKNSEPVTISYADKVFVFLGKIETWGEFVGIGGTVNNLLSENTVTVEDGGATAGTVSIDLDKKTITYTPNTSYNMGSVKITKLII